MLLNAPLGAGLQFANQLRRANAECQLNILELGALFNHARVEDQTLQIFGPREKVSVCGNSRNETRRALTAACYLSPALVPASNLLERGLGDTERLIRPMLILFGLLGGRREELADLCCVVNSSLTVVIRAVETELANLCRTYRLTTRNFLEHLTDLSAVHWDDVDCLDQALVQVGANLLRQRQFELKAVDIPEALLALVKQDISETFLLIEDLARVARLHMPILESIIELACIATKCNLRKTGRTLDDLGLFGMDLDEIVELVNA